MGARRPSADPDAGHGAVCRQRSPITLSARAGFFGSRPFSRANELLVRAGAKPIDWVLADRAAGSHEAARSGRPTIRPGLLQVGDQVFDVFDADVSRITSSGT